MGPARENERIVRRYGGGTGKRGDGRPDVHALTEVLGFGFLLAQSGHNWGGGPPWAGGGGNFWGPWMLVPFFFWAGLVALVAWIVTRLFPRRHGGSGTGVPNRDPAEEILRERFARGEIEDEEYLRSLEILRSEALPDGGATAPRDLGRPRNGGEGVR